MWWLDKWFYTHPHPQRVQNTLARSTKHAKSQKNPWSLLCFLSVQNHDPSELRKLAPVQLLQHNIKRSSTSTSSEKRLWKISCFRLHPHQTGWLSIIPELDAYEALQGQGSIFVIYSTADWPGEEKDFRFWFWISQPNLIILWVKHSHRKISIVKATAPDNQTK